MTTYTRDCYGEEEGKKRQEQWRGGREEGRVVRRAEGHTRYEETKKRKQGQWGGGKRGGEKDGVQDKERRSRKEQWTGEQKGC